MNPPSPSHHLVSTETTLDTAERCGLEVATSHMFSTDMSHLFVLKSRRCSFSQVLPFLTFSNSNHIKSYTSFEDEDVFDWTPCHPPESRLFPKFFF